MHVKQVQFHRIISPVLHSASCICVTSLKNVCTYLFIYITFETSLDVSFFDGKHLLDKNFCRMFI